MRKNRRQCESPGGKIDFQPLGSPPISTNQLYNDHINSFYRGVPKGKLSRSPISKSCAVLSHCQHAQLIFQPTTCGDTPLCVSLVNTETKSRFPCNFVSS